MTTFYCDVCERTKTYSGAITGYTVLDCDEKACYECCADIDRKDMNDAIAALDRGEKVKAICLYTTTENGRRVVTNWPGSLIIETVEISISHEYAFGRRISRFDVWFEFNGREWHGVNKGDNQILRCKPLKKRGK